MKEKSVTKTIEEVKEEICDKYCKFIAEFNKGEKTDAEFLTFLEEHCEVCPLNKL